MYDDTSRKAAGDRLKAIRDIYDLTQEDFAARAGIPRNTYNQYEKGKRYPRRDHEIALADAWGMTIDWISRGREAGLPGWIIAKLPPRPTVKVA